MTVQNIEIPAKTYARIAGALYLVIAVFGAFAIGYVPSVIIEAGNAPATASNLMDNLGLFRMGLISDIIVLLSEVVLTVMLYVMFKPVSPTLSLMAAWSRMAMVMVMSINLLINNMPAYLLNGANTLSGFDVTQVQTAAMVFFAAHDLGIYVWQLFFGMHLVALGYMIIKSDLFPRILGWMMLIGSFGYSVQGVAKIAGFENSVLSMAIIGLLTLVTIGELAFAFWLLIKGIKVTS
ncbi:MAG: DUF4386 domain-containing protein [Rhodobacteraceae bacterium]|nr:DUF4386 domain-containing protein [Paracoccaceae bacterium]